MNTISYNGKGFSKDRLRSVECYIGDSLVADELAVDTLTAVVMDYPSSKSERLDVVANYGDEILYYHKGELFGKFFLESVKRTGKNEWQLNCLSAVGLLMTSDHYGGLYNGETAEEVLGDIVGGIVNYTLSEDLASTPVYGLLRKAKRRDNLRDLLFAIGGQIRKDSLGELIIVPMTAGTPYRISSKEFYLGGSVTGGTPATRVDVTEHSFMATALDGVVTLYDGESLGEEIVTPKGATVTGTLVNFSEPMHDLEIKGAEILESGVNYAVVSSSAAAVLTGLEYTHTERILSRHNDTGSVPNVLAVKECTLVNPLNSETVADRVMAYYGHGKTIEADLVVTGQKPGDAVTFDDPFGDYTRGYIIDMELSVSSTLKAKATLVSGYIPTSSSGNYYTNCDVITEDGTYTVPENCSSKIRVVLIGGGNGGESGEAGEHPESYNVVGAGGSGGAGGAGGKVLVLTLDVTPGDTFDISIGAGGAGAVFGGEPSEGEPTTFGEYTTADGASPSRGYSSLLTGEVFAAPGPTGIAGGDGGEAGDTKGELKWYNANGESYYYRDIPGYPGEDVTYSGPTYTVGDVTIETGAVFSGAVGNNGFYCSAYEYNGVTYAVEKPGAGGGGGAIGGVAGGRLWNDEMKIGATPVKAHDGITCGSGGSGGHGGGGGGAGKALVSGVPGVHHPDSPGEGGDGGEGGNGANGCILIYYAEETAPTGYEEYLVSGDSTTLLCSDGACFYVRSDDV